ncbi:uncharacterized protein LOC109601207 [Aethina tumida]|uniref:uncharacterized protein LOC109601207 n=1 Tax=Aethina tumida TaxID=116153 RepID=UPI00096B4258|nr:uncharacterized protein LOC109601207 [Aethina tumida]
MKTDSNAKCNQDFDINTEIEESILTPLACATLINEFLKGIVFQKGQIPYPYSRLKSVVEKKSGQTEAKTRGVENYTINNHYKIVSSAFYALEEIMRGINREFITLRNNIKEVLILIGNSPQCPKEAYSVVISNISTHHIDANHMHEMSKIQPKVLRSIFLSQEWMDSVDSQNNCSNIFIFMKKNVSNGQCIEGSGFIPTKNLNISSKVKHVKVKLSYNIVNDSKDCCKNLTVFQEGENVLSTISEKPFETVLTTEWYQCKHMVKGFKDCFINKVSVSELW